MCNSRWVNSLLRDEEITHVFRNVLKHIHTNEYFEKPTTVLYQKF